MLLEELKQQLELLAERSAEIAKLFNLPAKQAKLEKLSAEAANPALWDDQNRAKTVMQEKSALEKELASLQALTEGIRDLRALFSLAGEADRPELEKELKRLQSLASELELTGLLDGEYDAGNAILSINAGAGGTDSQDWAEIMLRMYTRWAEKKGYRVEIPDLSYGDVAGIKNVTLFISGPYAFGYLKSESGVHRLVRISPFSSEGKRHTSFVSVEVIPEITEDIKVEINPSDLKVDTYRASGPGGQNVNKVSSAVRITHLPTGIVTQSQTDRSQHANRDNAMRILKAKLYEMMLNQRKEKIDELRGEKKKIEWGNQIRSYVFQPYTLVKDHRTGLEVGDVDKVINGYLDPFMEAFLRKEKEDGKAGA